MDPYLPPQAPPPPPVDGAGPPPPSAHPSTPQQPQQPALHRPTAWTTNFANHQSPQPPPPAVAAAPAFAPSERTKGASVAKNVILGLLTAFILLPILAIFALTMLGRTVEEEFVPVPMEASSDVTQAEAADAPVLAFEDVAAPANSQLHVGNTGLFTMSVDPSWSGPNTEPNVLTGLDSTYWLLEEYSSALFGANVNVAYAPQPAGATLDSIAQAEIDATRAQLDVLRVDERDRSVNGVTFRELTMDATLQGIDLTFYSVFRLDGDVVHMATLTTPSEVAAEARIEIEPYLLTLDVTD